MAADPTYPLVPIFSFLGFLICLLPLPWHLEAWNSATCFYMLWASIACLNQFVNAVVWANDTINRSPIWCDISIRIVLGVTVGIPASSLAINRQLYTLVNSDASTLINLGEKKWRDITINTAICVVFPCLFVAWQYVVQGHRFDIYEGVGCFPAIYPTWVSYVLSKMWPLVLGLISAIYGALTLRGFMKRRARFNELIQSAGSSLTINHYFRLMALATTEIFLTIPLATVFIVLDATWRPVPPWISWEDTHMEYARVAHYPAEVWRATGMSVAMVENGRWATVLCAFVFFVFFGFTVEARRRYVKIFSSIGLRLGIQSTGNESSPSEPQIKRSALQFNQSQAESMI